jgi:hypothetical protein
MVMFKAKFRPLTGKPTSKLQAQQQQQPQYRQEQQRRQQQQQPHPQQDDPQAPPIEKERGPQYPVKEPGPGNPPERAR